MTETEARVGDLEDGDKFYLTGDEEMTDEDRLLVVIGSHGDSVLVNHAVDNSPGGAFDRDTVVIKVTA